MKEIIIRENDSGQRFDKYLKKLLPEASQGFLYKMLRKKNITLNGKKAAGNEKIADGDIVSIFFSDATFAGFSRNPSSLEKELEDLKALPMKGLKVIYEDDHILALDKPCNMLSQKAKDAEFSANEYMLGYLARKGDLTLDMMKAFCPSVCNRLDRNTTGILLAGKSLKGLQELSAALKTRSARKYYHTIVAGTAAAADHLRGWLVKDARTNRVFVSDKEEAGAQWIETSYKLLKAANDVSLLEIHLITGRSHQIRAHLASVGHPVIGDCKYGNADINEYYKRKYCIRHQMLHACRIELPGKPVITAPDPEEFMLVMGQKE